MATVKMKSGNAKTSGLSKEIIEAIIEAEENNSLCVVYGYGKDELSFDEKTNTLKGGHFKVRAFCNANGINLVTG